MKKLITTDLGGQPVYFKDFEFIQEMIRELAKAALGHNDSTKVTVLNSFQYSLSTDGYTVNVTVAGWAYYQGEMFYVPIQSVTGSSPDVLKWVILESNDSRGLKTFKDETVGDKEVYKIRTLKLEYLPSTNTSPNFSNTVLPITTYPWTTATLNSGWESSPDNGINRPGLKYRINSMGDLELIGAIRHTGLILGASIVAVLPEGFRPNKREYFKVGHIDYSPLNCFVNTNGEIVFVTIVDLLGIEPPAYTTLYNPYDDIYFNVKLILNTDG